MTTMVRQLNNMAVTEAHKIVSKRWREKNKERIALVNGEWVKNNPDKMKAAQERYFAKNKEKRTKYSRAYRQLNPEKAALSQKKWRFGKSHKILEYAHKRRALLLNNTVGEVNIKKLLDEWDGNCGLCRLAVLGKYHIDHKTPLSKGGAHEQSNLQVTHPRCNQVKHNKLILIGV